MISYKTYSAVRPVSRDIITDIEKDSDGREVVFVAPEFAKAQIEREVLAYLKNSRDTEASVRNGDNVLTLSSSLVTGDVLSFRKLAGTVLDDLGVNYVAEGGEIMLRNAIYNILVNHREELAVFGTLSSRIDYINMMIALLGDFSRYGVGIDDIDSAIESLENSSAAPSLISKLKDLRLIMNELEEMNSKYGLNLLREPIALACDRLSAFAANKNRKRRNSAINSLLNSKIVFIGFGATRMLTPKEIKLVSLLSELGSKIEFYVLSGDGSSEFSSIYKNGEDFADMLEGIGAQGSRLTMSSGEGELAAIVEAFASDAKPDGLDGNGKVRLAELASIDDRVGYIFNEVIDLTRNHGYRYRDIRIVCCNEDIIPRMRSTAEMYGLDVFIDRKIALGGTVVPYMMQIILELPRANYSLELIMKAMRSGMLRIPPYIADSFENYCYAKNITDVVRLFDANAYIERDDGDHKKRRFWIIKNTVPGYKEGFTDSGEFFYEYVVKNKLLPLREACESIFGENTLSGKALASLKYFDEMRGYIEPLRDELLDRGDDAAAVALVRGYDELIGLLMCQAHEMNDCEISQKDFLSMIRTDMRNRTEGTIPLKVDSIEITTPEHAYVTPCKVLFIVGAQKDNFPYVRMREGLLSGIELKRLSDSTEDINLPDKAESKMREEFVTACLDLGSASDILYMIHEYGKPKSRVFEYLEKVTEDRFHIVNTFRNPIAGEAVKFRHDFENAKIPVDVMNRLLTRRDPDGNEVREIYASVSSIENFRECAFQYMLQRQLRIQEREDNTAIQFNSFGTLIHGMFEHAYKKLRDDSGRDPAGFKELAEELLSDETKYKEFTDECLRSSVSARSAFGTVDEEGNPKDKNFEMNTCSKLKRMFDKVFVDLLKDSVDTGFVPEGIEEKIGEGGLPLNIPYDGIDLKFSGFIDRFDVMKDERNTVHIRTIDYKSGNKKVESAKLLKGVQIQLPAYSGAILDKNANEGKTAVIDGYGYVQTGLNTKPGDDPLTFKPQLSGYSAEATKIAVDYSKYIIKESVDQIVSGKADAVLADKGSAHCGYCPFRGYCGNNPSELECRPDTATDHNRIDDEITRSIEADKNIKTADKKALLAMRAILEGADVTRAGNEG